MAYALLLAALVAFLVWAPLRLAAAALIGTTLLLVLLREPLIGLLLLPFTVPFGTVAQLSLAGAAVGATEALLALTTAAWLARGVVRRRILILWPPLAVPLLLWWAVMLLSTTQVQGFASGRTVAAAAKELVKWGEVLIAYVLAYNLIRDRRAVIALAVALLLAGALSGLHGAAGAVLGAGPPQFAILGGRLHRAFGTFGQPNPFGGYMNHTLPLAVSLSLAAVIGRRASTVNQARHRLGGLVLGLAVVAAAGIGLLLSWSRGAWLGAAAGLAVVGLGWALIVLRRGQAHLRRRVAGGLWLVGAMGLLVVLVGGLNLLPSAVSARLDSGLSTFTTLDARGTYITDANFATLERVAHWQAAWDMWRDHFWMGVGIGNYVAAYPDYRLPKWPFALGHAHNIYFNLAAETGFVGLLIYLLFLVTAAWHMWWVAESAGDWLARGIAIGALGVLAALAVHNLFDNLYVHAMGVHLALVLGLVSASAASTNRRPALTGRQSPENLRRTLGLLS